MTEQDQKIKLRLEREMSEKKKEIININTLAAEVNTLFNDFLTLGDALEMDHSAAYRDGFRKGVKALQMRVLQKCQEFKRKRNELRR